jgi:hypothetical protein
LCRNVQLECGFDRLLSVRPGLGQGAAGSGRPDGQRRQRLCKLPCGGADATITLGTLPDYHGGQLWWHGRFQVNWGKLGNLIRHIWPVVAVATIGPAIVGSMVIGNVFVTASLLAFSGMVGLALVGLLIFTAIFAEFMAPMDPNKATASFAPPDRISIFTRYGFTLRPVACSIVEGAELDPITDRPVMAPDLDHPDLDHPDLDHPRRLVPFAKGAEHEMWGPITSNRHLIGVEDGTSLHLPGTDKLGREVLSRGL